MIQGFCDWLVRTPFSVLLQRVGWIVPAVQTIHILLIGVVMAAVALFNARLLGLGAGAHSLVESEARFLPWVWAALPGLALTGALLIVAEPARELTNPAFATKLVLLLVVVIISALVRRGLRRRPDRWQGPEGLGSTRIARLVGGVSLALWVSIVIAGRWIAYVLDV
jgi:hypothetical protein